MMDGRTHGPWPVVGRLVRQKCSRQWRSGNCAERARCCEVVMRCQDVCQRISREGVSEAAQGLDGGPGSFLFHFVLIYYSSVIWIVYGGGLGWQAQSVSM